MRKVSIALMFILVAGYAWASDNTCITIGVLGDRTGGHDEEVFKGILNEMNAMHYDMIINVGDLIEGYTDDPVKLKEMWDEVLADIKVLNTPFHYVPGNHDIYNDVMEKVFKKRLGEPNYSFDFEKCHFVVLDTSRIEYTDGFPENTVKWLENDLKKNKNARYTFVLFHKPFWEDAFMEGKKFQLHDIFKKYGVDMVISGHYHSHGSTEVDGIKYVLLGSSGGGTDDYDIGGNYYQHGQIKVCDDGLHFAYIKQGSTKDAKDAPIEENYYAFKIKWKNLDIKSPLFMQGMTSLDDNYTLSIKNYFNYPLKVRVKFDTEGTDWTVYAIDNIITLKPEDRTDFVTRVSVKDLQSLYPLPRVKIDYPYLEKGIIKIDEPLTITRQDSCKKLASVPKIDAAMDDQWKTVEPETFFGNSDGQDMKGEETRMYLGHDDSNFYFYIYCKESNPEKIEAKNTEKDGSSYADDCIEFFIDPDQDQKTYIQFAVNPKGAVFDQSCFVTEDEMKFDKEWDGKWVAKAKINVDNWVVEGYIPLKNLDVKSIKAGDKWGFNFRRKQLHLKSNADWVVPFAHDPKNFGIIEFK
jgi:predicted phosphodiesterase